MADDNKTGPQLTHPEESKVSEGQGTQKVWTPATAMATPIMGGPSPFTQFNGVILTTYSIFSNQIRSWTLNKTKVSISLMFAAPLRAH